MIVAKAVNMAKRMNVPILGVVENMSYVMCPDCEKKIKIFDGENTQEFLTEYDLSLLGELPMVQDVANIPTKGNKNLSQVVKNTFQEIGEKIVEALK